ncbi:hypothetical protein Tco_0922496 [Tanacetum coccineum]|uniref:Retrovirus-related Pol polyprotein from transposon TNT 1-94-like beta-barrel domain-containing protein n=1 Tax=Tanacetum coccineum TaxID=301880 RepID=A0ABQ5CZV5_9ASTR
MDHVAKVTLDQLLSEQIHGNIVKALGGKGRRKENNPSKEVLFTKADEPLPPLPKLTGADPSGASKSLISLSDLTANMADLTLNTAFKKKSLNKLKGQSTSKSTPVRTARISKTFGECKYCGSNKHHLDDYEFYPGCEICGSIAHEIDDCPKNLETAGNKGLLSSNQNLLKSGSQKELICVKMSVQDYLKRSIWYLDSGCSRHMTGVKQYMHRYSKEPCHKVVFGDDSLGDTEGYGSVNCNGITFTRVAYGTIFNQNDEVVLIAPKIRDAYIRDMSSFNKESNACFLANASPRVNWLWHKRLSHLNFKNINNPCKTQPCSRLLTTKPVQR